MRWELQAGILQAFSTSAASQAAWLDLNPLNVAKCLFQMLQHQATFAAVSPELCNHSGGQQKPESPPHTHLQAYVNCQQVASAAACNTACTNRQEAVLALLATRRTGP